ncbi:protein phosphatase 2C domain-containing protein [Pseudoalteromonas shioyasakiensis]|uniref:PP2C family protein-serine/threonine phosphatase n=1 Tax=Pseudoalteromonas shioyasakiensis TaxID=1190813 RepID=UPI002118C419|nr:protein phosphatase 2C domain-containing protein [Pseudoalteromonas shioyasakiensis]
MNKNFISYAVSHRGVVRELNEDAYIELNKYNIWVVADGMGGHEAGDFASQLVVDVIKAEVQELPASSISTEMLIKAIKSANTKLLEYSSDFLANKTAGTTVTVLFFKDNKYSAIWVGDSRIYLYRANGLLQLSRDHSQINDLIDEGLLTEQEAVNHPLANVITRAVGVQNELSVDSVEGDLLTDDIFLLCSDGLTGELNDSEISIALGPKNIIDSGLALIHSTLVRGARDNVTFILVKNEKSDNSNDKTLTNNDLTVPLLLSK